MSEFRPFRVDRRRFLGGTACGLAYFARPGLFADELAQTPRQTEGPFFPDKLPLDTDNDLLILNDQITPAVGEITHLTGRVLDSRGAPLRNVVVEIWQCDHNGAYLHSGSGNADKRDGNFQGFGRFLTGSTGEYYFRTIKPVPYPGRSPHIHFKIRRGDKELLTTQCYIKGHAQNANDGVFRNLKPNQQALLAIDFAALPASKIGELSARFEMVLGSTPPG